MDEKNDNGGMRSAEAVRALRARGIDEAEKLLVFGTPAEILAACYRWDKRKGVGPGLLAKWIRDREFDDPEPIVEGKQAQLAARFDDYARRLPVGARAEPHARLNSRRYPDDPNDPCIGDLIVIESAYPVLTLECNMCGFITAYTPRSLHLLGT
jgi:hypothetical protein